MAVDPNEARSIVTAARRAGRVLTVYQPQRAIAWFQQASRLLRKGEIGAVYHVRVGRFNFARRNDWQSLGRFGGGMLNNLGSHGLDQLLSITGGEVSKVHCSLRQVASLGDTEDVVKIVYETRSGILGEVDINQACVTVPYEFEAYGTRGMLRKEGDTLVIARLASGRLKAKRLDASLAGANREYPHDEIRVQERVEPIDERFAVDIYKDLARAIRTGAEPFVKPEETLAVMRLIRRCRKSAGDVRRTPL